jgi:hypothetical protein
MRRDHRLQLGGIDSWGALTLIRTVVIGNSTGAAPGQPGTTSDADGGGIYSRQAASRWTT